jgi:hypothetical protein
MNTSAPLEHFQVSERASEQVSEQTPRQLPPKVEPLVLQGLNILRRLLNGLQGAADTFRDLNKAGPSGRLALKAEQVDKLIADTTTKVGWLNRDIYGSLTELGQHAGSVAVGLDALRALNRTRKMLVSLQDAADRFHDLNKVDPLGNFLVQAEKADRMLADFTTKVGRLIHDLCRDLTELGQSAGDDSDSSDSVDSDSSDDSDSNGVDR